MDSQDECAVCREFDINIILVSGWVSEWCLLVVTFPCVYDPRASRVSASAAAAAVKIL